MNIFRRLGWYLGGFSIGLIFLAFFLKKKKTEFCYGIDCRVLKNIRSKSLHYSDAMNDLVNTKILDSSDIIFLLKEGDVIISKSTTKIDSCKIYHIEGISKSRKLQLKIQNCNKTANVLSAVIDSP